MGDSSCSVHSKLASDLSPNISVKILGHMFHIDLVLRLLNVKIVFKVIFYAV